MSFLFMLVMLVCVIAVGGVVLVAVLAMIRSREAARARQAVLMGHAYHREWDYAAEDPQLVERFRGAPFGRGTGRRTANVLTGRYDGRPFVAFDYHHSTGSGESDRHHTHAVVALNLGVMAPDLAVAPTTTMGRWLDALTGRDVPIGDPAFDEHFTVRTDAPQFAADVLLSDVRDVMRHHPQLSWRITGDSLLIIRPEAQSPEQVEACLHIMDGLLDRVPPRVWQRLQGDQPR